MNLSAYEAETIINFNEEEDIAQIYTASKRVYNLLTKRGLAPKEKTTIDGKESSWFFEVPKWAILLKPTNKAIRICNKKNRVNPYL